MQGFGHLLRKNGSRSAVQINGKGGKVIVQILHRNGLSRVVAGKQQTKENLVAAATNCPSAFESVVSSSHSARPAPPLPPCSSSANSNVASTKAHRFFSVSLFFLPLLLLLLEPNKGEDRQYRRKPPSSFESCGCRACAPHRCAARCHTNTSKENFVSSLLMLTDSSYYYYYQLALEYLQLIIEYNSRTGSITGLVCERANLKKKIASDSDSSGFLSSRNPNPKIGDAFAFAQNRGGAPSFCDDCFLAHYRSFAPPPTEQRAPCV